MKQCLHSLHAWKKRVARAGFLRTSFFILALGLIAVAPLSAKQFEDNLATDFYAGDSDNIFIRQDVDGSLELASYATPSNWTTTKAPSNASLYLSSAATYNGKIYISGGFGSSESSTSTGPTVDNALNKVQYCTIVADGSIPDDWKEDDSSALPQPTYGHASVVVNRRLYIIGGRSTASMNVNSVYYAKIMGWDGSIKALYTPNTWTAVASLPVGLFRTAAVAWEGRIYVMGGIDSTNTARNLVYYGNVNPNGNISGWTQATAQLPTTLCGHNAVVSNGRIYVLGGSTSGEPMDVTNAVSIGTIDQTTGDITAWTTGTTLPEPVMGAGATISNGKIWISGGVNSGTAKSTMWFARLDRAGGLIPGPSARDTWTRTTDLPVAMYNHMMVNFNGHLYIMGGINNSGAQTKIYTSTLISYKNNVSRWIPTTSLFLSESGGGSLLTWTGHAAALRVPLTSDTTGSTNSSPSIFVIGGGPNTFNAYADGVNSSGPAAYSSVYKSEVNSSGSLENWTSSTSSGYLPAGSILHSATLVNTTQGNAIYVVGGANSVNAYIWAGAGSRSQTAYGQVDLAGRPCQVAETSVFYEDVGSATSTDGIGKIDGTSRLPILDQTQYDTTWQTYTGYTPNTATPIYQPLIRCRTVSYNGYLYVLGGISRRNINWDPSGEPGSATTPGSEPFYQNKVWFCKPNTDGSINGTDVNMVDSNGDFPYLGNGSWCTTTALPAHLYDFAACVAYGRIYIFGGTENTNPTATYGTGTSVYHAEVYSAPINSDGSLGAWRAEASLPVALSEHDVVFTSGRFYVMGGVSGGLLQNAVYYCTPRSDGVIPGVANLGGWDTSNTHLEYAVAGHSAVANNGFIYILGGRYNVTPSSSAYMTSITDMFYAQDLYYSWEGHFDRYIDLEYDQLVSTLNLDLTPNNETIEVKCRYALESGPWSDWTPVQAQGPFLVNRLLRYVEYCIHFVTNSNDATGVYRTPSVSRVYLDYAASKQIKEDSFQINHNIFDPQVTQLTISYKTRDQQVSNVTLRIYNTEGELIRKQVIDIPATASLPAAGSWIWDGTNENNELVASGVYIIQYNSGDTHKLRKVIVLKR